MRPLDGARVDVRCRECGVVTGHFRAGVPRCPTDPTCGRCRRKTSRRISASVLLSELKVEATPEAVGMVASMLAAEHANAMRFAEWLLRDPGKNAAHELAQQRRDDDRQVSIFMARKYVAGG